MNVVKCARLFFLISIAIPSEAIGAPSWCSKGTVQANSIQDFISITSTIRIVKGAFGEDLLQRNFSYAFEGGVLRQLDLTVPPRKSRRPDLLPSGAAASPAAPTSSANRRRSIAMLLLAVRRAYLLVTAAPMFQKQPLAADL